MKRYQNNLVPSSDKNTKILQREEDVKKLLSSNININKIRKLIMIKLIFKGNALSILFYFSTIILINRTKYTFYSKIKHSFREANQKFS